MTPNELHATAERALHLCRTAAPHIANRETMRLLRPLAEAALSAFDIDAQCKIAFAEMWEADHQGNSEKHFWYGVVAAAQYRYGRGERTEELVELMRQATRELTSK